SSKINPHFLFNSLNLMVSLLDDKEKAEDVLIRLSELLRYNLEASKKRSIPLKEEINSVEKYLFIQKERFGKRLDYEISGKSEQEIPPLLLQPLVENSIKHNLDNSEYIKISIIIEEKDKTLNISVTDSEALLEEEMIGGGTGLEVTRKRVELSFGKLTIKDGGINICLPMK
ncbi:MAG: histidine kinase, partial [Spirochaetaceae bacterium]|nr:histidine kinase [Spirochaetaceae bacterium]